jgi:hypothetical protein
MQSVDSDKHDAILIFFFRGGSVLSEKTHENKTMDTRAEKILVL